METLRTRDALLQENWYIACQSSKLKGEPLRSTIYDQHLVLFRSKNGEPVCLPDYCLHRHTPLSKGKVKDGCIVCPYHGWAFSKDGSIADIPSEKMDCFKKYRSKHQPKPTLEQDGFIWVWMGASHPPKNRLPWKVPYKKEKGFTSYVMETDFENEVVHLVENFLDVPHTVFVHAGWFRNATEERIKVDIETKQDSTCFTYHKANDKIGFIDRLLNPKQRPLVHTDRFVMPNISKVDYKYSETRGFSIISLCVPESSLKTKVYTIIEYHVIPGDRLLKPFLNWYTRQVINQDVHIMKLQGENLPHTDHLPFASGVADSLHIDIKKLRKLGATDPTLSINLQDNRSVEIWV